MSTYGSLEVSLPPSSPSPSAASAAAAAGGAGGAGGVGLARGAAGVAASAAAGMGGGASTAAGAGGAAGREAGIAGRAPGWGRAAPGEGGGAEPKSAKRLGSSRRGAAAVEPSLSRRAPPTAAPAAVPSLACALAAAASLAAALAAAMAAAAEGRAMAGGASAAGATAAAAALAAAMVAAAEGRVSTGGAASSAASASEGGGECAGAGWSEASSETASAAAASARAAAACACVRLGRAAACGRHRLLLRRAGRTPLPSWVARVIGGPHRLGLRLRLRRYSLTRSRLSSGRRRCTARFGLSEHSTAWERHGPLQNNIPHNACQREQLNDRRSRTGRQQEATSLQWGEPQSWSGDGPAPGQPCGASQQQTNEESQALRLVPPPSNTRAIE